MGVLLIVLLPPGGVMGFGVSEFGRSPTATRLPGDSSFGPAVGPAQGAVYPVNFTESGLPVGTSWSVTLNGSVVSSSGATVEFNETNGSYPYAVTKVSGYTDAPASGTAGVNGSAISIPIIFTASAPATYSVDFTEHGLPSGTSWSVTFNGTTGSSSTTDVQFNATNGSYPYTIPAASGYLPGVSSGNLSVRGFAVVVPIDFTKAPPTHYSVTFTETGLNTGTKWAVLLNGTYKSSTSTSVVFSETNGTYSYTIAKVAGYVASPNQGSVPISGANVGESVSFAVAPKATYTVTFGESGLPLTLPWSVTLNGTTRASTAADIAFNLTNGSYAFTIDRVAGFLAVPPSGTVQVSGRDATESISFSAATYPVTFGEIGLVANTLWAVTLGTSMQSSTHMTVEFTVPNGTYPFLVSPLHGYRAAPASGNVTINGGPGSVGVNFLSPANYSVAFTESGLPLGRSWGVTLGTHHESTTTNALFFGVPNGTYAYVVDGVLGYSSNPIGGTLTVSGRDVGIGITFEPILGSGGSGHYPVRFEESGLPASTSWGVVLNGTTYSSNSSVVELNATNGTYAFVIATVPGYYSQPTGGNISVNGTGVNVTVTFGLGQPGPSYPLTFAQIGLPAGVVWSVTLNGLWNQTAAPTMIFLVPNGTYNYTIHKLPGYVSSPSQDQITINGTPRSIHVTFRPGSGGGNPTDKVGGLSTFDWAVIAATAVIVVALIVGYLFTRPAVTAPSRPPVTGRPPPATRGRRPDQSSGSSVSPRDSS